MRVCRYWATLIGNHYHILFQHIDGLHCTSRTVPFLEKARAIRLMRLRLGGTDQRHCERLGRALTNANYVHMMCEEPLVPNALFVGMVELRSLGLEWRYFLPDDLMEGLAVLTKLEHLSLGGVCARETLTLWGTR